MRVLAVDPGAQRTGLAISDPLGWTARPLEVLEGGGRRALTRRLRELVTGYQVERVVIGLPLNMDGSEGPAAQRARALADHLAYHLGIQIELWDERLTTVEAEAWRAEATGPRQREEPVDAVAAAVLLQDYLRAHFSPAGG